MLRIGSTNIIATNQDVVNAVDKWFDPSTYVPWLRRSWPGFGLVGLAYPTGIRDIWYDYRQCKLNKFYWPTGASRWAFGHFVVSAELVDSIRPEAYGASGLEMNELSFTASCPGQRSVEILETSVYVLACTPIGGMTGYNNVNPPYLLTVADDRFWWYYKSSPLLDITDTTTWTNLFDDLSGALGVTIEVDTIASQYLNPSRGLCLSYEYLPVLIDAAVWNVGHRLIRRYDGTVATQSFQTSLTALQDDFANFPYRTVKSGGSRYLDVS
jgi:hypothetical protein